MEADFSDGKDEGGNNEGVGEAPIILPPAHRGGGGGEPQADRVEPQKVLLECAPDLSVW